MIVTDRKIRKPEIDKGLEAGETIAPRVLASQALKLVNCPKGCKGYKLSNWNVKIEIIFYASAFRNNNFSKILVHEEHHFNTFKMCYNQIDEFWGSLFKGECEKESCTQAKIDLANAFAIERYEFFRSLELIFDRLDYDYSSLSISETRRVYNHLNEQTALTEAAWKKASKTLNEAQRKVKDECAN